MSYESIELAKFDGRRDYALWKMKILAHMDILGLKEALKTEEEDDGEKSDRTVEDKKHSAFLKLALEEKKRKARNMILQSIEDQGLRIKIMTENTAAGMLQVLEKLYTSSTRRIYLSQRLYGFKMNESLSVEDNIDEFQGLVSDLSYMNVSIPDEEQALLLLISLPQRFDLLRDVLRYGRTSLTLDDVISAVKTKEMEFGSVHKDQDSGKNKCRERSKPKGKKGVCWICGEDGHYKNQCPSRNFNKPREVTYGKGKAAFTRGNNARADALMVSEGNLMTEQDYREKWILDTGCTFHLTPRRDWFADFHEIDQVIVKMGNETVSEVKGIGTVRLQTSDGRKVVLTNVRYIPKFSRNLISVGTLESQGCSYHCENGALKIERGCRTVIEGLRCENLYFLQGSVETGETNRIEEAKDETNSWHSGLDHLRQKGYRNT